MFTTRLEGFGVLYSGKYFGWFFVGFLRGWEWVYVEILVKYGN